MTEGHAQAQKLPCTDSENIFDLHHIASQMGGRLEHCRKLQVLNVRDQFKSLFSHLIMSGQEHIQRHPHNESVLLRPEGVRFVRCERQAYCTACRFHLGCMDATESIGPFYALSGLTTLNLQRRNRTRRSCPSLPREPSTACIIGLPINWARMFVELGHIGSVVLHLLCFSYVFIWLLSIVVQP